jgi:hypothetical protein
VEVLKVLPKVVGPCLVMELQIQVVVVVVLGLPPPAVMVDLVSWF